VLKPIDIPAVADCHYKNDELSIMDRVDDAIVASTNPVQVICCGQFLRSVRPRLQCQRVDYPRDALSSLGIELAQ